MSTSSSQMPKYAVDLVICIDATGSMSPVIEDVKASALTFHQKLEAKMAEKRKRMDQLRIRVIVFRDYWADAADQAMICSDFFNLPEQASAFSSFVSRINADGGGDEPENALEAIALAMQSPWENTQNFSNRRYIIAVWTDASAHPLEKASKPGHYPSNIPKTFNDLMDQWDEIPIKAKRILLFAPEKSPWNQIQASWENSLYFASEAGKGLEDFEMDEILDNVAASV